LFVVARAYRWAISRLASQARGITRVLVICYQVSVNGYQLFGTGYQFR